VQSSSKAIDEDSKPAQFTTTAITDAADPKPTPTRTHPGISSAPDTDSAAEPLLPPATAPAIVPAAAPVAVSDSDFPTPLANRGAALVESLYPRDQRVQSGSRASSSTTPVPAATATATTTSTTTSATTAAAPARPPLYTFAAAAAAAVTEELHESDSDHELSPLETMSPSSSFSSPDGSSIALEGLEERRNEERGAGGAVVGESAPARGEQEEEQEAEIKQEEGMGGEMEEGELSAAMSLSDESEL
jgi:hypothetical protein